MEHKRLPIFQSGLLMLLAALLPHQIRGQCPLKVLHTSGTQQVGCTSVTVTSEGSVSTLNYCAQTPYWIGVGSSSGSYTFTFSPPVSAVSLGLTAVNDLPNGSEEVRFEIDGVPYPITVPGIPTICHPPAIITPTGAVTGAPGQVGAWENMVINTTISTLKLENVIFTGMANGTVFSLYICPFCCETDAGTMGTQTLHACINAPAALTHNGDQVLDNNDLLRFILFTDPTNPKGSIISTKNTPTFVFNPATMQTDVTYYVAAIAGNNAGGNVNLNDPCLDISDPVQLIWHPLPKVALEVDKSNVCPGDCQILTALLTGTPPFSLTVSSPEGITTVNLQASSETFVICLSANAKSGNFTVQATSLTDAYCTCP